jgi:hypothetical protein
MSTDWFWEGNVVNSLEKHFVDLGWVLEFKADTASRQAGVDLHLRKGHLELMIEAKGYPSTTYQRGTKQGLPKPTNPATQARHWYAEAILCAMLRQHDHPNLMVAIAFPENPVFTSIVERTKDSLHKLGLPVLFVSEAGGVQVIGGTI